MVCTSLLCDMPLPRNIMQSTRFTAPIRTKPESVSSPCVQNPTRRRLMIGSGAHQAPSVARLQVSKRASGGLVTKFHILAKFRILEATSPFLHTARRTV
jgi:hypothetical protein